MPGIELLMESGASSSSIYDYIHQNSTHQVTPADVRNLIARLKKNGAQLSDDDAIAEAVVDFNMESIRNVSTVHQSGRGKTGVISVTSGHMFLERSYTNITTVLLSVATSTTSEGVANVDDKAMEEIRSYVEHDSVKFLFLPVNFNSSHWACLAVDKESKTTYIYDSMNGRKTGKALMQLVTKVKCSLQGSYAHQIAKAPRQKDDNNCGVFVCLFFWKMVSSDAPTDLSPTGLTMLRWKILMAVMNISPQPKRRLRG
ncbi:hypothetical protein F441_20114 [Phytophthora nicotianae CJ01A1]|nr:hypothetical protein L915_19674 [Phytophthora nicotianae]ETL26830.1 hypothetical protein L916_19559 [Phytophthora nicotianae]ETP02876.1 hypothetical protein F441_20114 [Phytophthora nicotianae CJ01A1]